MQNMLAYTIVSSFYSGSPPYVSVGQGKTHARVFPQSPVDDS